MKQTSLYLLIGFILLIVSNGTWMVPVAAWLAPIFLLRFFRKTKVAIGFPIGLVFFLAATFIMMRGLGMLSHIFTVYFAVLGLLPYWADKLLHKRIRGFSATLIFPVAIVSVEYLSNLIFGTWASLSYTQYGNLPFMQMASLTGIWGISFVVGWVGSFANWLIDNKMEWGKIKKPVYVFGAILAFIFLYGGVRLAVFPPDSRTVMAASFTPDNELGELHSQLDQVKVESLVELANKGRALARKVAMDHYAGLFERSRLLAQTGTKIVLWPEGVTDVLEDDEASFLSLASGLSEQEGIYLLVAYQMKTLDYPKTFRENKMVLFGPSGQKFWEYLKARPVPTSPEIPGDGIIHTADTPLGRLAGAICYDMDFPHLIHQAGRSGADIMLVPGWDWREITPLHTRMAIFRAIENGFSLIRQSAYGLSVAVDYQGQVVAAMDHFLTDEKVMIANVPSKGVKTLYSILGDYFAWLSLAGLVFLVVLSFRKS